MNGKEMLCMELLESIAEFSTLDGDKKSMYYMWKGICVGMSMARQDFGANISIKMINAIKEIIREAEKELE